MASKFNPGLLTIRPLLRMAFNTLALRMKFQIPTRPSEIASNRLKPVFLAGRRSSLQM
jgi:hypothetical protein